MRGPFILSLCLFWWAIAVSASNTCEFTLKPEQIQQLSEIQKRGFEFQVLEKKVDDQKRWVILVFSRGNFTDINAQLSAFNSEFSKLAVPPKGIEKIPFSKKSGDKIYKRILVAATASALTNLSLGVLTLVYLNIGELRSYSLTLGFFTLAIMSLVAEGPFNRHVEDRTLNGEGYRNYLTRKVARQIRETFRKTKANIFIVNLPLAEASGLKKELSETDKYTALENLKDDLENNPELNRDE